MRYTLYNKLLPLKHVTRSLAQNARVYVSGRKRSRVKIKVTEHIFPRLVRSYEGISVTKFNDLKVKRVKSNLIFTASKLVKKKATVKERNTKKATII